MEEEVEVEAEAEVEAEVLGSGWPQRRSSEGRQVSSCLFLKEMPLAVYQSRVEKGIFD